MATDIDDLHLLNVFRAGYRWGRDRAGSEAEADLEYARLPQAPSAETLTVFRLGAQHGRDGTSAYLLSYVVMPGR